MDQKTTQLTNKPLSQSNTNKTVHFHFRTFNIKKIEKLNQKTLAATRKKQKQIK